jgi:ribosomal protein S6
MPRVLREKDSGAPRVIVLANDQAMMFSQEQAMRLVSKLTEMLCEVGREDELVAQMGEEKLGYKIYRYKKNQYEWTQLARQGRR